MRSRYLQQHDGAANYTTFSNDTIINEESTLPRHTLNEPSNRARRLDEIANNNQPDEKWIKVGNYNDHRILQAIHCEGVLKNEGSTYSTTPNPQRIESRGTQSNSPNSSQYSEPPLQYSNGFGPPPCSAHTDRYWLVTANAGQYLLEL